MFGCKYDYGFWKMSVSFSVRYNDGVNRVASGLVLSVFL